MKPADFSGEQLVLQWDTSEDDAAWRAIGQRRFELAYAADDSVYESLSTALSPR